MEKDIQKLEEMLKTLESDKNKLNKIHEEINELSLSIAKMDWEYMEILLKENPEISEFMIQYKVARKFEEEYFKLEELKKKGRQLQHLYSTHFNWVELQEMKVERETAKINCKGE